MADWNREFRLAESEQSGELACDACGKAAPLARVVAYGIETMACAECRGEPQEAGEPWPPGSRAEFRPSPRGEPGISVSLTSTQRTLGELIGGFRRTADCPQIVTRIGTRAWRWLCIPKGAATGQGQ